MTRKTDSAIQTFPQLSPSHNLCFSLLLPSFLLLQSFLHNSNDSVSPHQSHGSFFLPHRLLQNPTCGCLDQLSPKTGRGTIVILFLREGSCFVVSSGSAPPKLLALLRDFLIVVEVGEI